MHCGCLCGDQCFSQEHVNDSAMLPHTLLRYAAFNAWPQACHNGNSQLRGNRCSHSAPPFSVVAGCVRNVTAFDGYCNPMQEQITTNPRPTPGFRCCLQAHCASCPGFQMCDACLDGGQVAASGKCSPPTGCAVSMFSAGSCSCATDAAHIELALGSACLCAQLDAPIGSVGQTVMIKQWTGSEPPGLMAPAWVGAFEVAVFEADVATGALYALTLRRNDADAENQDIVTLTAQPNCAATVIFHRPAQQLSAAFGLSRYARALPRNMVTLRALRAFLNDAGAAELANITSLGSCRTGLSCSNDQILTAINLTNVATTPGHLSSVLGLLTTLTAISTGPAGRLSGTIPTQIGQLVALQTLQLSNNHLNGTIPTQLQLLLKLQIIELQGNRLAGTAPHFKQQLTRCRLAEPNDGQLFINCDPLCCESVQTTVGTGATTVTEITTPTATPSQTETTSSFAIIIPPQSSTNDIVLIGGILGGIAGLLLLLLIGAIVFIFVSRSQTLTTTPPSPTASNIYGDVTDVRN